MWTKINCDFHGRSAARPVPARVGGHAPAASPRALHDVGGTRGESRFRNSDARPQRDSDAHRTSTDLQGGGGARPTRAKPGLETTQ